jgi:hypothetical protein
MPETAQLYVELWVSLASVLRSYTAVHGLNGNRQATVELGEQQITVRHAEAWLDLKRNGALVMWKRDDGRNGMRTGVCAAWQVRKSWIWWPKRGLGS